MFSNFQKDALERGRKGRGNTKPQVQKTWWQRYRRHVIAAGAFIGVVAIFSVIIVTTSRPSHNESTSWQQSDYPGDTIVDFALYGVHLNTSDQIDKIYRYDDLQKMSKKKRTASNVVLFAANDQAPADSWYTVPTAVTVDGVSYPINTSFDVSIDSLRGAIAAYNELLKEDPAITLRGNKGQGTLGNYVLHIISPKVTTAIKAGAVAAPAVAYNGTGTEYHNNDIATAYKAGINANLFAQKCSTEPSNNPDPAYNCSSEAQYDFSCKTVGIRYTNWSTFTAQLRKIVNLQNVQLSSPSDGQLKVNTAEPCRIAQEGGAPTPTQVEPQLADQIPPTN